MAEIDTAIEDNVPEEMVIDFKRPIDYDGKTFDAITLREFTYSQYQVAVNRGKGDNTAVLANLIQQVSGVHMSVINAMAIRDFNKASVYLSRFLA